MRGNIFGFSLADRMPIYIIQTWAARSCEKKRQKWMGKAMKNTMSNAVARRYFLHDHDTCGEEMERSCYFASSLDQDGWGFWVTPSGKVDVDETTSTGELPHGRIVRQCVRSAVKFLGQ